MWMDIYSDASKEEHLNWGSHGISINVTSLAGLEINAEGWIGESQVPEEAQRGTIVIGDTTIETCIIDGKTYFVLQVDSVSASDKNYVSVTNASMTIFAYNETGTIEEVYIYAF